MRSLMLRVGRRVVSLPARAQRAARRVVPRPLPSLARELARAKTDFESWWVQRGRTPGSGPLYVDLSDAQVAALCERAPANCAATLRVAESLLEHRFDLLGSGPFVPVDPDRPIRRGYTPIDWTLDPVVGRRFPNDFSHRDFDLERMRPAGADVKHPWELGRCQHWPVLAQSWRISRDERFVAEIAEQLRDFAEANPPGQGVQWACTMDVAIRAANWAIALELTRSFEALEPAFWKDAYSALYDHAVFITENLENQAEVTSNHFLSNLLGLYLVATVFADIPSGCRWRSFARHHIEREVRRQVLEDGADFESSIPYHRMVTEMFLAAGHLANREGEPLSPEFQRRTRAMVTFLIDVSRPDGRMLQLGDADDGRLHRLSGYGQVGPEDPRHLFAPAAAFFDEPGWWDHSGAEASWEAGWWGFEPRGWPCPKPPTPHLVRLFPQAGLAVARDAAALLVVSNGRVGTEGIGNHKHNDQLSFEFHLGGVAIVVDPGSYVYTANPRERNRFRSTAYHNTLRVDGEEQNELRPEWLFRLIERARPEHLLFRESDETVDYCGRHRGYERLVEPVTHTRAFRLLRGCGVLLILDRLVGRGLHRVDWHFHLDPGVDARLVGSKVELRARGGALCMDLPEEGSPSLKSAWISPSYGKKIPCAAVELSESVELRDGRDVTRFFAIGPEAWIEAARSRGFEQERFELEELTR